jgi:hypothetical protein
MTTDLTRIQTRLSIASFTCGVVIAGVCLFVIPPLGEIASSAISIVSEFLILAGALLGIKTSFDIRMQRFESEIEDTRRRMRGDSQYENEDENQ